MYVKVEGVISSSSNIMNNMLFRLDIIDPCVSTLITATSLKDVSYQVGQGSLVVSFEQWTESLGTCGQFNYTSSFSPSATTPPYTFKQESRTFEINVVDGVDTDISYTVKVKGTLTSGLSAVSQFTLTLLAAIAMDPSMS